jgi:hypothetical protein
MGLLKEMEEINLKNKEKVNLIWQKQQQK